MRAISSFVGRLAVVLAVGTAGPASRADTLTAPPGSPTAPSTIAELSDGFDVIATSPQTLQRLKPMAFGIKGSRKSHWVTARLQEGVAGVHVRDATRGLFVSDARGRGYALIDGGEVTLSSSRGSLRIVNRNAEVLVNRDGHWKRLEAGQIFVSNGTADRTEAALAAPPLADSGGGYLAVAGTDGRSRTEICWRTVTGASAYWITMASPDGGLDAQTVPAHKACAEVSVKSIGEHWVTIAAVDAAGTPGEEGRTAIYGVALGIPEGSFADREGRIHLARGHAVAVQGASDLEMALPSGAFWMPLPKALGASPRGPIRYLIRHRGSSVSTALTILHRDGGYDVDLGPKNPAWPTDDIDIVIARNSQGRLLPSWIEPKVNVSVGTDPVHVEFEHKANGELRARLPARTGEGPWIVRVDVTDQFGIPMGYGSVEVARAGRR